MNDYVAIKNKHTNVYITIVKYKKLYSNISDYT